MTPDAIVRSGRGATARALGLRVQGMFVAASLLFLAPLLLLPLTGAAQESAWEPIGLRGQTVLALSVASGGEERFIYAETATGLWRSISAASEAPRRAGWVRLDVTLPANPLGGPALAAWRVVPGRPRQIYALTGAGTSRALHRSDDGGSAWAAIGPAPGQAARPTMVVFAGSGGAADTIALATDSRAQRSTDGGATWSPGGPWPTTGQPSRLGPRLLLGDAGASERLYALSETGELWISETGGLAWRVGNPPAVPVITALTIAPSFNVLVWAASTGGLTFSSDGGYTWLTHPAPPLTRPGERIAALLSDPRVPETLYAATSAGALLRSADAGLNWVPLGRPGAAQVIGLALDPDTRGLLYAMTEDGVWMRKVVAPQPTPEPSPSVTSTLPPTALPTPTPTPTATASPAATATPTATWTPTPTASPTATASATPSRTPTRPPTATASPTVTATAEPVPHPTAAPPVDPGTPPPPPPTVLPGTPPPR